MKIENSQKAIQIIERYSFEPLAVYHNVGSYLLRVNPRTMFYVTLESTARENKFENFNEKYPKEFIDLIGKALTLDDPKNPNFNDSIMVVSNHLPYKNTPYGLSLVFPLKNYRLTYNKFNYFFVEKNKILSIVKDQQRVFQKIIKSKHSDQESNEKLEQKAEIVMLQTLADHYKVGKKEVLTSFLRLKTSKLQALLRANFVLFIPLSFLKISEGRDLKVWLEENVAPIPLVSKKK